MISKQDMINTIGKIINIELVDGTVKKALEVKSCQMPQDDDEEFMIETKHYLINQSEIKNIEILN